MQKVEKRLKKMKKSPNKPQKNADITAQIFGVTITGTQREGVIRKIRLQRKNLYHLATVNSEFVMEARVNPKFAQVLEKSELTVADGFGVVLGIGLLSGRKVERISGVEIVNEILKYSNELEKKVFLLGARSGVAEKASLMMQKKYPHARIMWYEGAKTVAVEAAEEASMTIAKINAYEPDYLLVAYGSPWQDIWIEENRPYLRVGMAVGVGGTLDEWAKVVPLCPDWIDRIGLKWLFRAVTQPWRLPRIIRVLQFGGLVLIHKLID